MGNLFKSLVLFGLVISMVACDDNIVEPCKDSKDIKQCVRDHFGKYKTCTVVQKSENEPVYKEGVHRAYVPKLNASVNLIKTDVGNLDGRIEKFYLNKETGNMVFSVDFSGISVDSKAAELIIHRRSKEPMTVTAHISGVFPVVLTAVIPASEKVTKEILKTSWVSAHLTTTQFDFKILPISKKNFDVETAIKTGISLLSDLPSVIKELFLTGAPDFFAMYLQKQICDYGIDLSELY